MRLALNLIGIMGIIAYIFMPMVVDMTPLEEVELGHSWIVSVLFLIWAELIAIRETLK